MPCGYGSEITQMHFFGIFFHRPSPNTMNFPQMAISKLFNPRTLSSLSSSSNQFGRRNLSLQSLIKRGFSPTLKDFNQFVLFLHKNHKFQFTVHFLSQMNSNQIEGDPFTHSIFARALIREQKYEEAEELVKTHVGTSSISGQNSILDSLIQGICLNRKDPEKALSVLGHCLKIEGIQPSSFTFFSLIHSFSSQGKMDRAIEVLEMMTDEKINYPFNNFVCSSVISGFCWIGKPEFAVAFYENAIKSGALRPNVVTYTALVGSYYRLGRRDVNDLISTMEKEGLTFDVIFYSSLMYECFREGNFGEAIRRHTEMVAKNINLDTISYSILIDGFSKEGNVEKAAGLLHRMIKAGIKPNVITYTAIMLGFCRKGKLEEAFSVFKTVEDLGIGVDEFMYATLIDGVCRRGDFSRVFSLLDDMEKKGIQPSIITYNTIINGLCKARRTAEAEEFSKGIIGDSFTYTTLLHAYIEENNFIGILETKRRFEAAKVHKDVVMCNIFIKALFMVGLFEDALNIYKGMPDMDLAADSVTYCTMIEGYCKVGRIEEALEIFDEFRMSSISSDACYNCIIHGLCKKGMVSMAIEVFIELYERGLTSDVCIHMKLIKEIFEEKNAEGVMWLVYRMENFGGEIFDIICNDAMYFLLQKGFSGAACDLYTLMIKKGSVVASQTYYLILKAVGDEKDWLTRPFLNTLVKKFGVVEPTVSKILVQFLCMKDVKIALRFLNKMKENMLTFIFPIEIVKILMGKSRVLDVYNLVMGAEDSLPLMNVVDYTSLVDSLCKGGHISKALNICAFAKRKGITLNIVTYNTILNGLCHQGCFVEAFRLFDSLEQINVIPSEITYATMIDALSKQGYLLDSQKLFERMLLKGLNPNTRVFNSLIDGYCKSGQIEEAFKILHDLEARHLKPDEFTVSAMVNGYCQKSDMEGALSFYFEFKRKGFLPDFLGFMFLVRGLCAKGRMEESRSVLREMLQTQSVMDLLNRVDSEAKSESIASFIVSLCEQGSIHEAIAILNEVGSMFFPVKRSFNVSYGSQKLNDQCNERYIDTVESQSFISTSDTNLGSRTCDVVNSMKMVKVCDDVKKTSELHDFDSYYSLVASLCSKGELGKASKLAKKVCDIDNGG